MTEDEDYDGREIDNNTQWYPDVTCGGMVVGRFVYVGKLNIPESQEADKKIYRKIVVLKAKPTGSGELSYVPLKAHNERELRARFPQAWQAFNGDEPEIEGTPIKELKWLTEENAIFLKLNGIFVIEQLAMLSDARCQGLGFGWRTNRNRAQEYLKNENEKIVREDRIERLKKKSSGKAA